MSKNLAQEKEEEMKEIQNAQIEVLQLLLRNSKRVRREIENLCEEIDRKLRDLDTKHRVIVGESQEEIDSEKERALEGKQEEELNKKTEINMKEVAKLMKNEENEIIRLNAEVVNLNISLRNYRREKETKGKLEKDCAKERNETLFRSLAMTENT